MNSATEKAGGSPAEAGPVIQAIDVGRGGKTAIAVGPPGMPPELSADMILTERRRAIVRSPFALLLHNWRLKRIRWAHRKLNRRLAAYEAAYGTGAFRVTDQELQTTGSPRPY